MDTAMVMVEENQVVHHLLIINHEVKWAGQAVCKLEKVVFLNRGALR